MRTEEELSKLQKINLGSGENQAPEYINVDLRADCKPDLVCDVRKLPFEDERFNMVFSSHTLEHISYLETRATLKEWVRILKRAGVIKIIVPNIKEAMKYVETEYYGTTLGILYGGQDYDLNFHKTAFSPSYLKGLLEEQGIEVITVFEGGYDLVVEGVKK